MRYLQQMLSWGCHFILDILSSSLFNSGSPCVIPHWGPFRTIFHFCQHFKDQSPIARSQYKSVCNFWLGKCKHNIFLYFRSTKSWLLLNFLKVGYPSDQTQQFFLDFLHFFWLKTPNQRFTETNIICSMQKCNFVTKFITFGFLKIISFLLCGGGGILKSLQRFKYFLLLIENTFKELK